MTAGVDPVQRVFHLLIRAGGAFYDGVTVMSVQEDWDATFAKLGRSAPAQRADEATVDYQRRLARVGRKYIPAAEEIARVRFDHTMPDGVVGRHAHQLIFVDAHIKEYFFSKAKEVLKRNQWDD
jgi:hypothetical protein